MSDNDNNNNSDDNTNVTPIRPSVAHITEQALQGAAEEMQIQLQRWEIEMTNGTAFVLDGDLSIYGNLYVLSDVERTPIWTASADKVAHCIRLDTDLG